MDLSGQQLLPLPRDRVWSALQDPALLQAAIPGCEFVTDEGNGVYAVGMLAAVGPVKARFKGRLRQQDLQPPVRYALSFEGDGGIAGFAKGSAEVELAEAGDGGSHTQLVYRAQAQIGGRMAQIGSRLVDASAARLSAQFFERLTTAIGGTPQPGMPAAAPAGPEAPPAPVVPALRPQAAVAEAGPAGSGGGVVTLQMPAWAWAFTVAALTGLIGWLAVR